MFGDVCLLVTCPGAFIYVAFPSVFVFIEKPEDAPCYFDSVSLSFLTIIAGR